MLRTLIIFHGDIYEETGNTTTSDQNITIEGRKYVDLEDFCFQSGFITLNIDYLSRFSSVFKEWLCCSLFYIVGNITV